MARHEDDSRLERHAAVGVLIVWGTATMVSMVTGQYDAMQAATAVALVAAGYLFGSRIFRNGNGRNGNGNGNHSG